MEQKQKHQMKRKLCILYIFYFPYRQSREKHIYLFWSKWKPRSLFRNTRKCVTTSTLCWSWSSVLWKLETSSAPTLKMDFSVKQEAFCVERLSLTHLRHCAYICVCTVCACLLLTCALFSLSSCCWSRLFSRFSCSFSTSFTQLDFLRAGKEGAK